MEFSYGNVHACLLTMHASYLCNLHVFLLRTSIAINNGHILLAPIASGGFIHACSDDESADLPRTFPRRHFLLALDR